MKRILSMLAIAGLPWTCGAQSTCDNMVAQLHRPAGWTSSVRADITTWRSADSHQAVTLASYAISPALTAHERAALAARATERERGIERGWSSLRLSLSSVVRREDGSVLQLCHTGVDPEQRRRFASVTRVSRGVLRHVYYESVERTESEFALESLSIFDRFDRAPAAASQTLAPLPRGVRVPALPALP